MHVDVAERIGVHARHLHVLDEAGLLYRKLAYISRNDETFN